MYPCGCCASECNKLTARQDDFLEPYVFTKANRFVLDSRDDAPMAHIQPAYDQWSLEMRSLHELYLPLS